MTHESITPDSLAIPITDHRIHPSTHDISSWSIAAGTHPFFMPIFLTEQLPNMFPILSTLFSKVQLVLSETMISTSSHKVIFANS